MSFATAVKSQSEKQNIFLVSGGRDKYEREAWYYVRVNSFKASIFQRALSKGKVDLKEFGEIIKSGFGKTPPEDVKKLMKEQYNFETEN